MSVDFEGAHSHWLKNSVYRALKIDNIDDKKGRLKKLALMQVMDTSSHNDSITLTDSKHYITAYLTNEATKKVLEATSFRTTSQMKGGTVILHDYVLRLGPKVKNNEKREVQLTVKSLEFKKGSEGNRTYGTGSPLDISADAKVFTKLGKLQFEDGHTLATVYEEENNEDGSVGELNEQEIEVPDIFLSKLKIMAIKGFDITNSTSYGRENRTNLTPVAGRTRAASKQKATQNAREEEEEEMENKKEEDDDEDVIVIEGDGENEEEEEEEEEIHDKEPKKRLFGAKSHIIDKEEDDDGLVQGEEDERGCVEEAIQIILSPAKNKATLSNKSSPKKKKSTTTPVKSTKSTPNKAIESNRSSPKKNVISNKSSPMKSLLIFKKNIYEEETEDEKEEEEAEKKEDGEEDNNIEASQYPYTQFPSQRSEDKNYNKRLDSPLENIQEEEEEETQVKRQRGSSMDLDDLEANTQVNKSPLPQKFSSEKPNILDAGFTQKSETETIVSHKKKKSNGIASSEEDIQVVKSKAKTVIINDSNKEKEKSPIRKINNKENLKRKRQEEIPIVVDKSLSSSSQRKEPRAKKAKANSVFELDIVRLFMSKNIFN